MSIRMLIILFCGFIVSCSSDHLDPLSLPINDDQAAQGEILTKGIAACGFCHGENADPMSPLSGGQVLEDYYGEVIASNLTPSASGLKKWNIADIIKATRSSEDRRARKLSPEVHRGYQWLSDKDAISIASYLRSIPPVEKSLPHREISRWEKYTVGIVGPSRKEIKGFVPSVSPSNTIPYGKYLVDHMARCGYCHNSKETFFNNEEYLAGGGTFTRNGVTKTAPDLSPSTKYGLGDWTETDIIHFLRSGITRDGRAVDGDFCPVRFYKNASEQDIQAIAVYLKSLKP